MDCPPTKKKHKKLLVIIILVYPTIFQANSHFMWNSPPTPKNVCSPTIPPGTAPLSPPSRWCMCRALPAATDAAPFEGILRQLGATAKKDQL